MYYVRKTWHLRLKCPTSAEQDSNSLPRARTTAKCQRVAQGRYCSFELMGTLVTLLIIKLTEHLRQESSIKQITTTTIEMLLRTRSRWVLAIAFLSFSWSLTSLAMIFNVPFTWKRKLTDLTNESFCNIDNWPVIYCIKEWKAFTTPPPLSTNDLTLYHL